MTSKVTVLGALCAPSTSVTTKVTLCVPGVAKVNLGWTSVELDPSGNVQLKVKSFWSPTNPSGSVLSLALNTYGTSG